MRIIERIKERTYQRSLPAQAARSSGAIPRTLAEAKRISIHFDATQIDHRQQVIRYAEQLRKQGKAVELLGYIPQVDKEATFPFNFYTDKQIDWAKRPKGEAVTQFLGQSVDAFVCLFSCTSLSSEFIALHSAARLKIGPVSQHPDCYDLMLDMIASATPTQIIKQYEAVFEKMGSKVTA